MDIPYLRKAPARAREILRHEGAKSLWFRGLGKAGYRRMILFERLLDEPIPEIASAIPVTTSLLKTDEIDEYLVFRPGQTAQEILERLKRGHKCFALRSSNVIAHACWAGIGTARMEYLDCEIRLADRTTYLYGSFTAGQFRKLNLATVAYLEMARHFRDLGFRRLVAVVVPHNRAALGPVRKAGYRRLGVIRSVKIGSWRSHSFPAAGNEALQLLKKAHGQDLPSRSPA
jgi:hypothetical protein